MLFDENWQEVSSWQHEDRFATDSENRGWREVLYLNKRRYLLEPGNYHFALQIRDPESQKIALYQAELPVQNFDMDSVQISSIILAKNVTRESPQSLFTKDGMQFAPKFNPICQQDEPVSLYFEIYHLQRNDMGQTDYEVIYSVWPYARDTEISDPGKRRPIIRTSTQYSGKKLDEKVWMSFDFSGHDKDKYTIEIAVRDHSAKSIVRKLVPIELK